MDANKKTNPPVRRQSLGGRPPKAVARWAPKEEEDPPRPLFLPTLSAAHHTPAGTAKGQRARNFKLKAGPGVPCTRSLTNVYVSPDSSRPCGCACLLEITEVLGE